ncbi:MAG: ABC transporter permease [Candidatus Eisenbacteria bacterium]
MREPGGKRATRPGLLVLAVAPMVVLLVLPLAAVYLRLDFRTVLDKLAEPEILDALRLSLTTSICATFAVVMLGTPLAYLLATRGFVGRHLLEALVDLPMVLPPTVAGFALLMAFGRAGLAGGTLGALGIHLPFTTAAVVVAQAFMAAPFYVSAARAGFQGVDSRLLEAAATLGADERARFVRVMAPLAAPALAAGATMTFARALGEFGATITFAGNLPGATRTLPLAVYVALQSDLDAALVLSAMLLAVSFVLLLALRGALARPGWMGRDAAR